MATLDTPTTIVLNSQGDSLISSNPFSVAQGFYAQTRVPEIGEGNVVNLSIVCKEQNSTSTGQDYAISFTKDTGVLTWFIGGILGEGSTASGTYTSGDLFAIYASSQEVAFTRNGVLVYKYPEANTNNTIPALGLSYKFFLLFATGGPETLTFSDSIFYPAGSKGNQGKTFTTLTPSVGSPSIITQTALTLTASLQKIVSQEFLSPKQGMYIQFRVSPLVLNDSVTVGFFCGNVNLDFFVRVDRTGTAETDADYAISVTGPDKLSQTLSGGMNPGDLMSLYLDNRIFSVSRNGTPYTITTITGTPYPFFYVSNVDTQYQLSATCTQATPNNVFFSDVMFYPTGSPGFNGDSIMELVATPDNRRVLSPNSVRLELSTDDTYTAESIDGLTSGIMCQFSAPVIPMTINGYDTTGNQIQIGMYLVGDPSQYCRFALTNAGYTCGATTGTLTGIGGQETGTYTSTDVFSLYSDGTTIYFYKSGVAIATTPYEPAFTPVQMRMGVASSVQYPYDITNIRFYPTGKIGATAPTVLMGKVARVDSVNGYEAGVASIGGLPFSSLNDAIDAAATTSGVTIWVLPGTYSLTSGITIPANTAIRGLNVQTCIVQMLNVTADTDLITMGSPSRLEDLTLRLTSQGHYTLKGLVFGGTTTVDAKLRTCVLTVDNSAASSGGTSNVYGVECNGSGTLGPGSFSFNALKGSTINVYSNGGGNKRGVLVSASNVVSSRDLNIYVAKPTDTASLGSYVGLETNDPSSLGSIQLRSTSIGTVAPVYTSVAANIQKYTAADIYQSTPVLVENPSYLATAGIQIGPGTDIVTKKTGARPFSTYVYPNVIQSGLKGNLLTGQNGFLWSAYALTCLPYN